MARTRSAVIDGTLRSIEKHGSRRTTMSDVAALAGVAKATLYNHFRTKPDVFAATVESEVDLLGAECARVAVEQGLAAALAVAAERLGSHPAARRIATDEPAVLARLATPAVAAAEGRLAGHPGARRIAPGGPAVLPRLATPAVGGAWPLARSAVAAMLSGAGKTAGAAEIELALRWLVTFIGAPGSTDEI